MNALLYLAYQNIGSIASFIGLIGIIGSMIFYSHRSLHKDMLEIKKEAQNAHERIDAMGARIDAMGARIDGIYTFLMAYITGKTPNEYKGKNE